MAEFQDEENVRALFLQCAALAHEEDLSAETRTEIETRLRPRIRTLIGLLANKLAARPPAGRWTADAANAGYLLRVADGIDVRVPFHLFDDIAPDDVFDELLRLGSEIRMKSGALCLSGSSAIYGALRSIGDCDFCEYLDDDTPDALKNAADSAAATGSPHIVALAVSGKTPAGKWRKVRPWESPLLDEVAARATTSMMAQYAGQTDFAGTLEVTKVILPKQSWDRSFSAQELPVTASGGWVPRTLGEPRDINNYVNFLRGEVEHYKQDNLPKAVKRAFSLARILFFHDVADELRRTIRTTSILLRAAAAARTEYASKLTTDYGLVPEEVRERAATAASEMLDTLAAFPDDDGPDLLELLERFVSSVDARIATALD
jgi:hypothetical protein